MTFFLKSVQWANFFVPVIDFILTLLALLFDSRGQDDAVATFGWGGGWFSCTLYVTCTDDESPCMCPWNAGLSQVPGDGPGVQRRISDLCDLRAGDHAAGAVE